jgi:DNA processing protein
MPPIHEEELLGQLALTFVDGVGTKTIRALINRFGTASEALHAPLKSLKSIYGLGEQKARALKETTLMKRAEEELAFIQRYHIKPLFFTDPDYPNRLKNCDDAPSLLFYRGNAPLEQHKMVAIVGTRKNSDYGLRVTEALVAGLQGESGVCIVSGLAFGIDAIAHRKSLQCGIPTIGVVGHGLDRIYPSAHKSLAREMLENGGILTEFPSGTKPDRTNFPLRNRVVAGLTDVTVLVESDLKGGAMITAYMARYYNREVAAYPGRTIDQRSAGPNKLIRDNIAALITEPEDLLNLMNWSGQKPSSKQQHSLFENLDPDEERIMKALEENNSKHMDELHYLTGMEMPRLSSHLLQMEMRGLVRALPGKMFQRA